MLSRDVTSQSRRLQICGLRIGSPRDASLWVRCRLRRQCWRYPGPHLAGQIGRLVCQHARIIVRIASHGIGVILADGLATGAKRADGLTGPLRHV